MRSCKRASRAALTLVDLVGAVLAGVPGRGEYLNENAPAKPTSSTMRSVREIVLGFPGKSDDEIRRKRNIGPGRPQPVHHGDIIGAAMPPVHGGKDAVRARLDRQMQLRHQLGKIAMRRDEVVIHIAGWLVV